MKEKTGPDLLKLLIASAYSNYSSSLIGSGLEITKKRFVFFSHFGPGDLVMEISSLHVSKYDQYRIGYLVTDQMEPYGTDEWWEENKKDWGSDPRPMERVYTIRCLLTEKPFRWSNARMIRVVSNIQEFP